MTALLDLSQVTRHFGGLTALREVSLQVQPGQIKAVIGPNGAGKTTLFNLITGVFPPSSGSIHFQERELSGRRPHQIAALGISRTFQTAEIFHNMTLLENVLVGRHNKSRTGFFRSALKTLGARREEAFSIEAARHWLNFTGINGSLQAPTSSVPFVIHRKVEIARALATEPKLLLLDEPAAGLNIRETEEMGELIRRIREEGVTVLLIEHDMSLVMDISDEICVLNFGEKIAEGTPKEIHKNEAVIEAYLGKGKN